jgi:uncharacterized protein YajQ (UPF0234 family)
VAKENSFDVVAEPDWGELANAIEQTRREAAERYDFRGQQVDVQWDRKADTIVLEAGSEQALEALVALLEQKVARRGVPLTYLTVPPAETVGGGRVRCTVRIRHGLDKETLRDVQRAIRELGLKVKAETQQDAIRVSGKSRDELQQVIQALKARDFGIALSFVNFR